MKKASKQFLIIGFILGYLCFGIIAYSKIIFSDIFSSPLYLFLFISGFLSPFISAFIVFIFNKDELGGLKGFLHNFKTIKSKKSIILIPIFLIGHYGLGMILKNTQVHGNIKDFLLYLPMMLLILGSQEIGWRKIVQPAFEEDNGYLKSIIITGLFWALWFFPLIFIKGFIILPQFFTQFAAYLVGISFLLTSLYKSSGSILYCTLLSSLIFAITPVIVFKQSFMLLGIAILEALIGNVFKNKEFN